jgi:hydroxyacid-oxoacid transhydrogenase
MTEIRGESVFTWGAPPVKFGAGALDELWFDLRGLAVERVLIITDRGVAETGLAERVRSQLVGAGLKAEVYDGVSVEPTDESLRQAVEFAGGSEWDGFVALGGGSSIDTAKAVNLMTTYPGDVMEYVNAPIGEGKDPAGSLKPLVAVPTTAGTGSESTPVCILDILSLKVKSGISHHRLRPTMAVIDPLTTLSMPPEVTAACGMDVVCHALESYTARSYNAYERKQPEERVAYCGANPISDAWSEKAMSLIATSFRRAVLSGMDVEARTDMALAATFAGLGFGNAGVHIPHACGYPLAGMVRDYRPAGYPDDHPLVPHGQSVSVTAPESFRFTYPADPDRHLRAARLLGAHPAGTESDRREALPAVLVALMQDIGIPSGVAALGYTEDDIPDLVEGTMKQKRLLVIAPREVRPDDVSEILRASMRNW